jgi:heme/copper-type cytochrome/quinol oxidase subunit 2
VLSVSVCNTGSYILVPVTKGGRVLQRLFTLAIVLVCLLWIVLSYLPQVQAKLPVIAFSAGGFWLAVLAILALVAFIAIQFWLLYTTVATVRSYQAKHPGSLFHLKLGAELFWTALPIAMSVGLAWASYSLWLNYFNP